MSWQTWVGFGILGLSIGLVGCQPQERKVVDRLPPPVAPTYKLEPAPVRTETPRTSPPVRSVQPTTPVVSSPWKPRRPISPQWNCIIIHHSESDTGSLRDIDSWHKAKGWDGCGYHFVIGNGTGSRDGQIEMSYRWHSQLTGAHCRLTADEEMRRGLHENYYNEHGIGICLVGRFNDERPTPRQMESTARLVRYLMDACSIPSAKVYGHGDLKATDCPGRFLSMGALKRQVDVLQASAHR